MREELDEIVVQLKREGVKGVSRSSVARTLLQKSLGNDAVVAEVRETMAVVWMVVMKAMSRITSEVETSLPGHLEEAYQELAESGEAPAVTGAVAADSA